MTDLNQHTVLCSPPGSVSVLKERLDELERKAAIFDRARSVLLPWTRCAMVLPGQVVVDGFPNAAKTDFCIVLEIFKE